MGFEIAATDVEEKKPDRPPSKTPPSGIYPVLNKYSEKTASVKELTTSKISMHKENSLSKESSTQSTITHTNKTESEKIIHNETVNDGTLDGQIKKPPVPLKKSPTPSAGVGGLLSGLKSKMLSSSDKEKSSSTTISSGSSSGGEWDRTDGGGASKPAANANANANANTFDHVERNSILNDPRAGRVKAPRRRPPSQVLRDDSLQNIGLSNGHEGETTGVTEKPSKKADKADEIKPRAREWERHKAPWMEELKLNQAKKTVFADGKPRAEPATLASKAGGGSTDRILECGLEEKRSSSHSMEMSKSTSSISSRMSVLESFEETKVRHSLDSKKDVTPAHREDPPLTKPPTLHSPTAAGRTLLNMLDEIKKPHAPPPPLAPARPPPDPAPPAQHDKPARADRHNDVAARSFDNTATLERLATLEKNTTVDKNSVVEKNTIVEKSVVVEKALDRVEKVEDKPEKPQLPQVVSGDKSAGNTLERRLHSLKHERADRPDRSEGADALIAQLNSRITNLEKLIEVQNAMFTTAVSELTAQLRTESDARLALQTRLDKLEQLARV